MTSSNRTGSPLLLYVVLVLLFAPMVVFGLLWATMVLTGVLQGPNVENMRAATLVWMIIAMACGAIALFADILLAPFVLHLVKLPKHGARAGVFLLSGLLTGAAAYVLLGGSMNPFAAIRASGFQLSAHGEPNWALLAPAISLCVFIATALSTSLILRAAPARDE